MQTFENGNHTWQKQISNQCKSEKNTLLVKRQKFKKINQVCNISQRNKWIKSFRDNSYQIAVRMMHSKHI